MKIVKPLGSTLLCRNYEVRRAFRFGLSVLLCTDLAGRRLYSEQDAWAFLAPYMAQGLMETSIPRSWAEFLVFGAAHPPDAPASVCEVEVRVGRLRKLLRVWGRRYWNGAAITDPEPFESLPLDWSLAAGGEGDPWNPKGVGHQASDGRTPLPVPCLEYPDHPWTRPGDRIPPAGFGPIDQTWEPRRSRTGTYDDEWFENLYPGIATDADWRFFNLAPDDQQQPTPFEGTEPFLLRHLHPEAAVLEGRLPGLRVRAFMNRDPEGIRLEEIETRLMALWFFPSQDRLVQVFQGGAQVREEDAADIRHLLVGIERLNQDRPARHYAEVLNKRLDEDKGALESLRDADLAPEDLAIDLFDAPPRDEPFMKQRLERAARKHREEMRASAARAGLDPDEILPPVQPEPVPELRTLDDLIRITEELDARAASMKSEAQARLREAIDEFTPRLAEIGIDAEEWAQGLLEPRSSGPPGKPGREVAALLDEMAGDHVPEALASEIRDSLDSPRMRKLLEQADRFVVDGYRMSTHQVLPPPPRPEQESARLREEVLERLRQGDSLAGMDLTGCDLAGLQLPGADLRGAFLEHADLSSCDLSRARLEKAVLAHARLIGTRLDQADLRKASLGAARLENASLQGADLRGAILDKALLRNVDLSETRLDDASWLEARFETVDFSASRCEEEMLFLQCDLSRCRFRAVRWKQLVMLECRLTDTDLSHASFEKAAFVQCAGERTRFAAIRLGDACFAKGCRFPEADFRGCAMEEVSLRDAELADADFSEASVVRCDFSECNLEHARFRYADASGCLFRKARLEGSDFEGARLVGADLSHAWIDQARFRHANLHESDWGRVRTRSGGVDTRGALTSRVRTRPLWERTDDDA